MAWTSVTVQALTQGVAGAVVTLAPGETAHVQVVRTGIVTDLILAQIFGVLEDPPNPADVVPLFAFGLRAGETSLSFILRGVWGWRCTILNGTAVPTGTVTANLRYRKDGVDVG